MSPLGLYFLLDMKQTTILKILFLRTALAAVALLLMVATASPVAAQRVRTDDNEHSHWNEGADSVQTVDVPIGLKVWRIEPRFAQITPCEPDTFPHGFQNDAFTEGRQGTYNTTGNLGSPRTSRLFFDNMPAYREQFLFARPYDFFLKGVEGLQFTNTKSPITNLTYHSCGNKQNGEDRITALFATNAGKRLGMGFKLDYLYGRGYYEDQNTAHFNGILYGSYRDERYVLHTMYDCNHLKNTENGGIEDDNYVNTPEAYPTKYGTADMPILLGKAWNKLNVNTFYLSHHYNLGFVRHRDDKGNIVARSLQENLQLKKQLSQGDSLQLQGIDPQTLDTITPTTSEFVPVSRILHTLRVDHHNRLFLSNKRQNASTSTYFNDFYLPGDSAHDYTKYLHVANTVAFELCEGFNPWMKAGLRLFARHDFDRYQFTLPHFAPGTEQYNENRVSVGGQLLKTMGRIFRFNVLGELTTTGKEWGEFNVEGNGSLNIPLRRDSLSLHVRGFVRNDAGSFYYRHYHARNAWWDNEGLNKEFRGHVEANIGWRQTRVNFHFETIQNLLYFQEQTTPVANAAANAYLHGVTVKQHAKNVSLIGVTLNQDFRWGIFNWENALTYQVSSNKDVLPVPAFNAYTNLYLKFRFAKVLLTELGADLRYFTKYYATTYSPIIGQYCVQDEATRVKVGNYPIVNVYANFHLKHTRFYVMASHVNYKSGAGNPFLVPHYPINRLVFRLGLSWNFFN